MTTMIEVLDCRAQKGEIGIEVELEGHGLPMRGTRGWRAEADGSLRGEAVEFVLKTPVKRQFMAGALKEFSEAIDGAEIEDSGRAGIHIHINIQELTPRELAQFMCLYLVFENTLVEWCGQGRVGNLFCLRCDDAPGLLEILRAAFHAERWDFLDTDEIRYASMNAKAVATYGSLEFRAMRSTPDTTIITQWVKMLLAIKDKSRTFRSPMEIVEGMSLRGTEGFFDDVLGKYRGLKFRNTDLMHGVRNAQQLAYSRADWESVSPKTSDYTCLDVIPNEEVRPPKPPFVGQWVRNPDGEIVRRPLHKPILRQMKGDTEHYLAFKGADKVWLSALDLQTLAVRGLTPEGDPRSKDMMISWFTLHWDDLHHGQQDPHLPMMTLSRLRHRLQEEVELEIEHEQEDDF